MSATTRASHMGWVLRGKCSYLHGAIAGPLRRREQRPPRCVKEQDNTRKQVGDVRILHGHTCARGAG